MRVPIICLDARLRQFAATFRDCFSLPHYRYCAIVLLALLLCRARRTLPGLLRQAGTPTLPPTGGWRPCGGPFRSKIDLMEERICTFQPLAGTRAPGLLDSWFAAQRRWRAARRRGFLITTGLKRNRHLRGTDPTALHGWRWQALADYAAGLRAADDQQVVWPSQDAEPRQVWAHVAQTRVKQLYRCQVIIVRESLEAALG